MQWNKLLQIDDKWVQDLLNNHIYFEETKVRIRGYALKFSGNLYDPYAFADCVGSYIPEYVFTKKQINEKGERRALREAARYFGKKQLDKDGKYGELILFMLVESILKCPMVAHKIKNLTNFRDQIKGGDGIFLGDYEYMTGKTSPACLIGESKVMKQFSVSIKDALDSINRFHDKVNSPEFKSAEFAVAKGNLLNELDDLDEVNYIMNSLTPGTKEYIQNILVHPILIIYETVYIENIEKKALTTDEAEELIRGYMVKHKSKIIDQIKGNIALKDNLEKLFLDFFIIPFNDIKRLRNEVFYQIHSLPYEEK